MRSLTAHERVYGNSELATHNSKLIAPGAPFMRSLTAHERVYGNSELATHNSKLIAQNRRHLGGFTTTYVVFVPDICG